MAVEQLNELRADGANPLPDIAGKRRPDTQHAHMLMDHLIGNGIIHGIWHSTLTRGFPPYWEASVPV